MTRAVLVLVLLAFVAGCGGDDQATSTETLSDTVPGRVYWLRDGQVWPVARALEGPTVAAAALTALYDGPSDAERADLGLETALPEATLPPTVTIEDGEARLRLDAALADAPLAQLVYTLTQFPNVDAVEIDGRRYTRTDFEEQTPSVLVESPLSFDEVTSPLRATGSANTFEATFDYEVTDSDGRIVDEGFVTATSGTGTRGTFDVTTNDFTVPFGGVGSLVVFERSAEDGSRIHVVEIPLRMSQ